jgi:hypothetical protein
MLTAQSFRKLPIEEQLENTEIDFSNWKLWTKDNLKIFSEDLTNKMKATKLKKLSKKLKEWDYTYVYSDSPYDYKKGVAQEKEIQKLYKEIGAEGLKMYRDFLKSKGMMESNLSPSDKASIKRYMKELEKLCKKHNWHWMYEKDDSKFKQGQFQEQSIREIVIEIKELGSMEGFDLYQKFAAKNGIKINYFKESGMFDYERYYLSKMKKWGIKDIDELSPENKRKFNAEVDNDWKGGSEVEFNMPEHKSVFNEMKNVEGRGTLDYAIRQVGDKSLTASTFGDSGNLYPEHLVPKFIPPSKERLRHMK